MKYGPRPLGASMWFLLLLLTACGLPTAPESSQLQTLAADTTTGVTFLPPVGDGVAASDSFDPTVPLTIEIFELNDGRAVGPALRPTFATADGTITRHWDTDGSEGFYLALWNTRDSRIPNGSTVRVEVRTRNATTDSPACDAGPNPLDNGCVAFFTVKLWANQGAARRAPVQEDVVHLVNGQSLPIRFHVERGAVALLGPNGGVALTETGVIVGAPVGVLDTFVRFTAVETPNPDLPLPDAVTPQGQVIALASSSDVFTEEPGDGVIVGIPVPDTAPNAHLGVALFTAEAYTVHDTGDFWAVEQGVFDAANGLFLFVVPAIPVEGIVMQLVSAPSLVSPRSDASQANAQTMKRASILSIDTFDVRVTREVARYLDDAGVQTLRTLFRAEFEEALARYRSQGYEPRSSPFALQTNIVAEVPYLMAAEGDILPSLQPPTIGLTYVAHIDLGYGAPSFDIFLNRITIPITRIEADRVVNLVALDKDMKVDVYHELFHSVQKRYLVRYLGPDDAFFTMMKFTVPYWLEGTAALGQGTVQLGNGSPYPTYQGESGNGLLPRRVDVQLIEGGEAAYEAQDFWAFLGTRFDLSVAELTDALTAVSPVLGGRRPLGVDDLLRNGFVRRSEFRSDFATEYWAWVKNQAYERTVVLNEAVPPAWRESCAVIFTREVGSTKEGPHGDPLAVSFSADPGARESWDVQLDPLQARWIEVTLTGANAVTLEVTTSSPDLVEQKIYLPWEEACWTLPEDSIRSVPADRPADTVYVLVANTAFPSPFNVTSVTLTAATAAPVDVPLVGIVPGAFSLTGGQFTITVSPRDGSNGFVEGDYDVHDFSFRFIEARQVSSGLSTPGTAVPTNVTTIAPGTSEDATLVLSFDASGSMTSNDPGRLRVAAGKDLIDLLGPEDEAAIIEFASSTRVLQTFTSDKVLLKSAIDRVTQSGLTYMYGSLATALSMLDQRAGPNPAIVILTDGIASDRSRYASVVAQAQAQRTPIFTIGLGAGVNATELQSLARETNGTYAAATDASGLAAVFDAIGVGVTQGRILVDGEGTFASALPGPGGYVVSGELVTRIGGSFIGTPFDFFVDIR